MYVPCYAAGSLLGDITEAVGQLADKIFGHGPSGGDTTGATGRARDPTGAAVEEARAAESAEKSGQEALSGDGRMFSGPGGTLQSALYQVGGTSGTGYSEGVWGGLLPPWFSAWALECSWNVKEYGSRVRGCVPNGVLGLGAGTVLVAMFKM